MLNFLFICIQLIDQISNGEVRKRIKAMAKRPCYDEDDKLCLLHVLTLLNNLDALSRDQDVDQTDQSSSAGSSHDEVCIVTPQYIGFALSVTFNLFFVFGFFLLSSRLRPTRITTAKQFSYGHYP